MWEYLEEERDEVKRRDTEAEEGEEVPFTVLIALWRVEHPVSPHKHKETNTTLHFQQVSSLCCYQYLSASVD